MDKTDKNATGTPRTDPNTGLPARPDTSYDTIRPDRSDIPGFAETLMPGQGKTPPPTAPPPRPDPVAVKIIDAPRDHESAQRELQALDAMKNYRHLHLLSVQAFYSLEDKLVIISELADDTLHDRLQECRRQNMVGIPLPELLMYMR